MDVVIPCSCLVQLFLYLFCYCFRTVYAVFVICYITLSAHSTGVVIIYYGHIILVKWVSTISLLK